MILAISDEAVILEKGTIVHKEKASTLSQNQQTLDRFLGVTR